MDDLNENAVDGDAIGWNVSEEDPHKETLIIKHSFENNLLRSVPSTFIWSFVSTF